MKKGLLCLLVLFISIQSLDAQVTLDADGPGNTYSLITSILAPNNNPIEVPDCGHAAFGDHIDEVFDADLNTNVFRFYIHVNDDDDRCINFDRQRNEIKTYDKSPDNLLGVEGETVEYKWKFKLDAGFQSSPNFTHIHQLKAVGGTESSMPLITLTTRKGTPDELELRYAETTSQVTLHEVDIAPFLGVWVEVTETVEYGENGKYDIEIKQVSNGNVLFTYTDNDIRMWKTDADFIRPKWGIYRSLNNAQDLRDEAVLFANFSITETTSVPVELMAFTAEVLDDAIQLNWQTASEFNNMGFEVQRAESADGNWETIDFVQGNTTTISVSDYEYLDDEPLIGANYYRLRQIDWDGQFEYSDTVVATFKVQSGVLKFFPNPVKDTFTIEGVALDVLVEIYTIDGQKVSEGFTNQLKLDISDLAAGTYLLHIYGQEKVVQKLIKQ